MPNQNRNTRWDRNQQQSQPSSKIAIFRRPATAAGIICLLLCSCGMGREPGDQQPTGQSGGGVSRPPAPGEGQNGPQKKEAAQTPPPAPVDPNKFAIIISGVGGEDIYTKKFTAQAFRLHDTLTSRLGFGEKNMSLLTETGISGAEDGFTEPERSGGLYLGRSTEDEVRKAFERVKAAAKPDSLVLIVMIGHGSFDNQEPKFNLVGPDFAAKDYAKMLASLPTKHSIFVNCSSASGEFVKPLSAEGRITITATRTGTEQNITIFADNFISALSDDAADTDKNGRLSVLEAFNYASKLTADWYKQKDQLATEHPLIDDNGDGVGHEKPEGGDGTLASVTYLDSKPLAEAGGNSEIAALLNKRQQLEESIAQLKAKKAEMKPDDYSDALEKLLVELAKLDQQIKAQRK